MKKITISIFTLLFYIICNAQTTIYTNNMSDIIGDTKQAFIQNKITTQAQADNLIIGMKNMGVNGIRIPIFADGLNPNETMYNYFYTKAVAAGFKIFANPAQSSGGARIACGILDGTICTTKGDDTKTTALIDQIKAFANTYKCTWINPFNEDGAPGAAWSASQMNLIYLSLQNNMNGVELIGPCVWGIPASISVLNGTNIINNITVATSHNLGFNHGSWPEFIALAKAKNLPVWDSEATNYDKYGTGTRIDAAIAAGVNGVVLYDSWGNISLTTGAVNSGGKTLMGIYLKDVSILAIDQKEKVESELLFPSLISASGLQLKPFSHQNNVSDYQLDVYTLQGQKIFTSTDIEKGWKPNGTNKGFYIYTVKYRISDGKLIKKSSKVCCII